jgi:hypothetical protein
MPAVAWVTVVLAVLIVLAAAIALLRVIIHLAVVRQTLGTVVVGVQVVAAQTAPVPGGVASVNSTLKPVRDFCESIPGPEEPADV